MQTSPALSLIERIPTDYQELLQDFLSRASFQKTLEDISIKEKLARVEKPLEIFPAFDKVFNAFHQARFQDLKVVLMGQDPYHTPGLAQGLAFSIPENIDPGSRAFPSSLRNISKALMLDGYDPLLHGDLSHWAKQGVLLLNNSLTVAQGIPQSHQSWQWQVLTDAVISCLANQHKHLVWLLWGKVAQKKIPLINPSNQHLILTASHPSGLGVYQTNEPFLVKGDQACCGHFKKTNEWLTTHNKKPIKWSRSIFPTDVGSCEE
jgi:uracil-DNA glycosylase